MLEDSTFTQRLSNRWSSLRDSEFSNERILFIIDSLANLLSEAKVRNFNQWDILGEYIWPNYFIGGTYEEEIKFLIDWVEKRLEFLDEDFPKLGEKYNLGNNEEDENDDQLNTFDNSMKIYPNPSSSFVNIHFSQNREGPINLSIYNILGQKIVNIFDKFSARGNHSVKLPLSYSGRKLAAGIYICTMELNYEVVQITKLAIVK